jgi:hypothetical protein
MVVTRRGLQFCNFFVIFLFTDYVVAKIDDLVNWGRRVSVINYLSEQVNFELMFVSSTEFNVANDVWSCLLCS